MTRRIAPFLVLVLATAACARGTASSTAAAPEPAAIYSGPVDSALVRFTTSKGEFDVMLRGHWAPIGSERVVEAVDAGYYDGARFFRALRGFVVQFGLAADPAQSAAWRERRIADDSVRESNRRGTLTFAAGGAGTRTVQLFVNLRDNARLDAMGFAPVGEVVRGIDVVDALYTGYGEAAPSGSGPPQGRIGTEGEEYLAREFPLLDQIRRAQVIRRWPVTR
jgi:peptidyl-prolyl cis-trans isomerase A (cyclophilin A)